MTIKLDQATRQWIHLVHSAPNFIIRAGSETENATITCPEFVPKNEGEYWLSGTTKLKNGTDIPSVFRVETDTGGTLIGVYWLIESIWYDFQDRPKVFKMLKLESAEIFPFDWSYNVPLEEDIFH